MERVSGSGTVGAEGSGQGTQATEQAKQQGQQLAQQARQQAGELANRGTEQVKSQLANQKHDASQRMVPVQSALRETAQQLRKQGQIDKSCRRVRFPEERSSRDGLVLARDLQGVVRQRRAEVRAPCRLSVIAIGSGVGENVDTTVAYLDGERICVGVRCDREEPVRTSIAPAPDLRLPGRRRPKEDHPCVGKVR